MRTFKPVLSGKGLLAASVALVSGQALAETAGRVSFVSGEVTASQADGSNRILRRGDAINAGDKISTRAGRLQVRFTDGGFVSLQPNSVFAVDEYLYTNRKPEETSLFFSLLQGGMRTITGTIGKVNKKSYQVRTPVATIGIRGTEYLASLGPNGLVVSVGQGFVNVENGMGNVTAGARQNVAVRDTGSAPSLSEEKADVQASTVNGDQEQPAEEKEEEQKEVLAEQVDATYADKTVGVSDAQDEKGNYVFVFQSDGFVSGPGYSAAIVAPGNSPFTAAGYDHSKSGGTDSTLNVTFDGSGVLNATQAFDGEFIVLDRGNAVGSSGHAIGNLKWGAWGYNDPGLLEISTTVMVNGQTTNLDVHDFVHYIVGRMTPAESFYNLIGQTATYGLQGGTFATGTDGSFGALGSDSYLSVQFGTTPFVSANLFVNMKSGESYHLTGSTSANVSVFGPASASGMATFSMSSMGCSYQSGGSGGCGGAISGLFAGPSAEQIGLAYQVDDFSAERTVTGTGAFGMTSITTTPVLALDAGGQ